MKKIVTLIVGIAFIIAGSANRTFGQTLNYPWYWGFNMGAAWQHSDISPIAGLGWGFTLGKYGKKKSTNAFVLGWRLQYLSANTYGLDYKASTGIAKNPVLNGKSDTTLDYADNGGYVYQNYKTNIHEGSFELTLMANKLRQQSNILFYLLGGGSIVGYQAYTNQLDANGKRYDYSQIDPTTGKQSTLNQLNGMYDNTYETHAEGSSKEQVTFAPTVGAGIGYQFSKGFAIAFEQKLTFPPTDLLDGQQWNNNNQHTGSNDFYYYASLRLIFSIGTHHHTTKTNANNYTPQTNVVNNATNNAVNNTGVHTSPDNFTNNNNTVTVNTPVPAPGIHIISPSANPYTTSNNYVNVSANVSHVSSPNQIKVTDNGYVTHNFSYNTSSGALLFPAALHPGNNYITISATNSGGTNSKGITIYYQHQQQTLPKPQIIINYPQTNPYTTSMQDINIRATVLNISSANDLHITLNGQPTNNFNYNYNSNTHALNIYSPLTKGSNYFVISAHNSTGQASMDLTVIYAIPVAVPKPDIVITYPYSNPYQTSANYLNIDATVNNVSSKNNIHVYDNGHPVSNFTYNVYTKSLAIPATLTTGNNNFTISASNQSGNASKSLNVVYNAPATVLKPVVTISYPNSNPYHTLTNSVYVSANVINVTSSSNIGVSVNGNYINNFNYNIYTKALNFSASLIQGNNTITVTGNNQAGSDSKTIQVFYDHQNSVSKPVVNIVNPGINPYHTGASSITVTATVNNISSSNDIYVSYNGSMINNFTFNSQNGQVNIYHSLVPGTNNFIVTANNQAGTDSKSINVIYDQPQTLPKPVITVTSPAQLPYVTQATNAAITGIVKYVNSQSNIKVTLNGSNISQFQYNPTSNILSLNSNLQMGSNNFMITATNASGTVNQLVKIVREQPHIKPVITITNPPQNPFRTSTGNITLKGNVKYINSRNDMKITVNGQVVNNFQFNNTNLTFSLFSNLNVGMNSFYVTATNAYGVTSRTIQVDYIQTAIRPIVTIISPTTNPYHTTNPMLHVTARVNNVSSRNNITVLVDNKWVTNFTYNTGTHLVKFSSVLNLGNNIITVKATNRAGNDIKSFTTNYSSPTAVAPPKIVMIYPNSFLPVTSSTQSITVKANVLNVNTPSEVHVTFNGAAVNNFHLSGSNLNFTVNLHSGSNAFNIKVQTPAGQANKSFSVKYIGTTTGAANGSGSGGGKTTGSQTHINHIGQKATTKGKGVKVNKGGAVPVINMIAPASSPYKTQATVVKVTMKIEKVSAKSEIHVKLNNQNLTNFVFTKNTGFVTFIAKNLKKGVNTVDVSATNSAGTVNKKIVIEVTTLIKKASGVKMK